MPTRFLLLLLALVRVPRSPALAAPERWEAVSKTAMAITGNVRFSPNRITFQKGKFLALAPAGTIAGSRSARVKFHVTVLGREIEC
jgi:hypothetical protein